MDRDKAGCIGYIIGGIILFSCQFIGACVSTKSTYQAASDLGFSNVHIIEHDYMFYLLEVVALEMQQSLHLLL